MKRWLILFVCVALPSLLLAVDANPMEALHLEATTAHENGDYAAEIEHYQQMLEQYQSAAIYYNMGNAYYQLGEMGQAILAYARSLVLDPDNPDTLANLKLAQEAAEAEGPERIWSENYAQSLSVNTWTWIVTIGFWAMLALLILPGLYRWRSPWRPLLLALSILALTAGGVGLAGYHQLSREGVVLANDAPLQLAPTANSPAKTFLQVGATADVKRTHGDYVYVETPTGEMGWISLDLFGKIWR